MAAAPTLLGADALFMALAMVWPSLRVLRQTGRNPFVLASGESAEGFVGIMFRAVLAALGAYLALLAAGLVAPVGLIAPTSGAPAMAGWALIALSLLWVLIAQRQMGRAWRIGIDRESPAPLVARGLFRMSRNPIFLGMMAMLAGLVLVQPDAITLTALAVSFVLISVQIRFEEAFLAASYGEDYRAYRAKVRRWL